MSNLPAAIYIGLDMAWSERNCSGAAALMGTPAGAQLVEPPALLGTLDEIVAFVARFRAAPTAIIAVDAPLRVPNLSGRRPAEAKLGNIFRAYEAGAYPANRRLLDAGRGVRGELLVERLAALGFVPAAQIVAGASARLVTEVYPHAAAVALFGLPRTLKYKARPQRSEAVRHTEWRQYQAHLRALAHADPALRGHEALLAQDTTLLRGQALKGYEDRVDALLCAYIALFAHRWGAARCHTFGDLETGFILTPLPSASGPGSAELATACERCP